MSAIWPIAKSHLSFAAKCALSSVGLVFLMLGGGLVFISLGIDLPPEGWDDERDSFVPESSVRGR